MKRTMTLTGFVGGGFLAALAVFGLATGCAGPGFDSPPVDNDDRQDREQEAVDLSREIEEADIVKELDGFFYLVNPYRGLRIIDARQMNAPTLAGGVPLGGRGVELFVRNGRAFVFTASDFLWCAGSPLGFAQTEFMDVIQPDYDGSRLWVVDVMDPTAPALIEQLDFDGFVSATRRVDEVLYVAGQAGWRGLLSDPNAPPAEPNLPVPDPRSPATPPVHDFFGGGGGVFVASISIADPLNVHLVAEETVRGTALDIHVSDTAMYVFGTDPTLFNTTLITYVDISDSSGAIAVRSQFRVPGEVRNRFFVDEHEGMLRIITEEYVSAAFTTSVRLFTYDISNPDAVTRLAELPVASGEGLRVARFDGVRGYAMTWRFTEPLYVLDLADAAAPRVAGELRAPGFSTHLVPLGNRLLGVGFDDSDGVRPSVALYDVANPAAPRELSRIIVGDAGRFDVGSEATVDEKALKVIESAGLVLLPFSRYEAERGRFVDALQVIGLGATRLREHGQVEHPGLVRRAGLRDGRLWLLSDLAFQTVGIDDLDAPARLGLVTIISEQELLDAGLSGCADSARIRGTAVGQFFYGGWPFGLCLPFGMFFHALVFAGLCLCRTRRDRAA